jgi:hypothetical protein
LLARVGHLPRSGLPGALQGAVDRGDRGVQQLGGFARREVEHLAQQQSRALARGQVLEHRDEGELDALALLVPRGRPRRAVLAELLVGIRLDPHRFGQGLAGRRVRRSCGGVTGREAARRPARDQLQACVGRDLVEPRADRASLLEASESPPRAQQRLLQRVVGVVEGAEHAVAVRVQGAAMRQYELAVGALVASARTLQQLRLAVRQVDRCRTHLSGS